MTRYIQHNQKCFACGLHKAPAHLGYNIETMKTYCTEKTPCEKAFLIPAGELIPVTNEDLLASITENFTEDIQETFNRLLGKVASTRLQPAHIMHLLKTSKAEGLASIQATLVNIIEADMKARNVDHIQIDGSKFTHKRPVGIKESMERVMAERKPMFESMKETDGNEEFKINQTFPVAEDKLMEFGEGAPKIEIMPEPDPEYHFTGPSIKDILETNEAADPSDPPGELYFEEMKKIRAEEAEEEKRLAEEKARILQEEVERLLAERQAKEAEDRKAAEEKAKEAEEDDEWEI